VDGTSIVPNLGRFLQQDFR